MKLLSKTTFLTTSALALFALSGAHAAEVGASVGLNAGTNSASKGAATNSKSILQGGNAADANIQADGHGTGLLGSSIDLGADADAGVSSNTESSSSGTMHGTNSDMKASGSTYVEPDSQFTKYDEDKNGSISKSEFSSSLDADVSASSFAELDTNEDGQLSRTEFDAMAQVDIDAAVNSGMSVK